jgi:hypothetical protein
MATAKAGPVSFLVYAAGASRVLGVTAEVGRKWTIDASGQWTKPGREYGDGCGVWMSVAGLVLLHFNDVDLSQDAINEVEVDLE